jgi:hypothetical protein
MNTARATRAFLPRSAPWYARQVIHLLQEIKHGCMHVSLPNGIELTIGEGVPDAYIQFLQWSAFRDVLTKGDIGFAEGYLSGAWNTPDLTGLLCLLAKNAKRSTRRSTGAGGASSTTAYAICSMPTRAADRAATSLRITIWATTFTACGSTRR